MGSMADGNKEAFQERIQRIQSGGPGTMGEILVGPPDEEALRNSKKSKKGASARSTRRLSLTYPVKIAALFLAGMAAVLVARLIRFHFMGGTLAGDDPDFALMLDGGIAIAVAFCVGMLLRAKGSAFTTAKIVGIAAMIGCMHNLVHAAPGVFASVFSLEWVEEVVDMTEPNSILFRGNSIVLGAPRTRTPLVPPSGSEPAVEDFGAIAGPVPYMVADVPALRPRPRPAT